MQRPEAEKLGHKHSTGIRSSKKEIQVSRHKVDEKHIKKLSTASYQNSNLINQKHNSRNKNDHSGSSGEKRSNSRRDEKAEFNMPSKQISMVMQSYYNYNIRQKNNQKGEDPLIQSGFSNSEQNSASNASSSQEQQQGRNNPAIQKGNLSLGQDHGNKINAAIAKKHMALEKIMNNMFYEFDGEEGKAKKVKKEDVGKSQNMEKHKKSKNASQYKNDKSRSKLPKQSTKKKTKEQKERKEKKKNLEPKNSYQNQKILQGLDRDKTFSEQKNHFVDQIQRNAARQMKYERMKRKTRANSKINQLNNVASDKNIASIQNKIEQQLVTRQQKGKHQRNKSNTSLSITSRNSSKHINGDSKPKKNLKSNAKNSDRKNKEREQDSNSLKSSLSKKGKNMLLQNCDLVKSAEPSHIQTPKKNYSTHREMSMTNQIINQNNCEERFTKMHIKAVYFDLLSRICGELLLTRETFDLAQYYFVKNMSNHLNSPTNRHQLTNTSLYDLTSSYVQNISAFPTILLTSLILAIKMDDSSLSKPFFRQLTTYSNHHSSPNKLHYSYYQSLSTSNLHSEKTMSKTGMREHDHQSLSAEKQNKQLGMKNLNSSELLYQEDKSKVNSDGNKYSMLSFLPLNLPAVKSESSGEMKKEDFLNRIPLFKKRIPHRSLPYLKKLKQVISEWTKSDPSANVDIPGKEQLLKMEKDICMNMQYKFIIRTVSHYIDLLTFLWDDFIQMLIEGSTQDTQANQKFKKSIARIKRFKNHCKYLFFRKPQEKMKFSYLISLVNYYKFYEENYQKSEQHHDLLFVLTLMYLLLRINISISQEQPEVLLNPAKTEKQVKEQICSLKNQLSQSTNAIYADDTGINILFTEFLDLDYAGCNIKMEMIVNYCQKVTNFLQKDIVKIFPFGQIQAQPHKQSVNTQYGSWASRPKPENFEGSSRKNSVKKDERGEESNNQGRGTGAKERKEKDHEESLRYHFYNSSIYKHIIKECNNKFT